MYNSTHKNPVSRIQLKYTQKVAIPSQFASLLWDEQNQAPLEKLIYRVLTYGIFDDIKLLYTLYPEETVDIISRYPNIKRGVRFWIQYWHTRYELNQSLIWPKKFKTIFQAFI